MINKIKTCTLCKKEFPATLEYFHAKKGNLTAQCKSCRIKKAKEYRKKARTGDIEYKVNVESLLSKKEIENQKFKIGKLYKVTVKSDTRKGKGSYNFTGKLIQETKNFITLENKKRIRESFLKVDFKLGARVKEV